MDSPHPHLVPPLSPLITKITNKYRTGFTIYYVNEELGLQTLKLICCIKEGSDVNCKALRKLPIPGLFAGVVPRVTWISLGGAVFFGVYEKCKALLGTL